MARLPRYVIPGQPQHVIQRGNNRQAIFGADEDYRFFLDALGEAAARHCCDIHAYVLMTNHVHLLMTPHDGMGIGKVMQSVGRKYVQYFNHRYGRSGTLWEGRYRATLIDSEHYLFSCMHYIELNPVRAGMVDQASAYPWSSYKCNALGKQDELVTPHLAYLGLAGIADDRWVAYRACLRAVLDVATADEIREATNRAWVLGCDRFKAEIEGQLGRRVAPSTRGGDRKSSERVNGVRSMGSDSIDPDYGHCG